MIRLENHTKLIYSSTKLKFDVRFDKDRLGEPHALFMHL